MMGNKMHQIMLYKIKLQGKVLWCDRSDVYFWDLRKAQQGHCSNAFLSIFCLCSIVPSVFLLPKACSGSSRTYHFATAVHTMLCHTTVWALPVPLPWWHLHQPVVSRHLIAAHLWPSHEFVKQSVRLPPFPSLSQMPQYNDACERVHVYEMPTVQT